jgi:hypothetical protein
MLAIRRLGITGEYDEFHRRKVLGGVQLQNYQGELSDDACSVLRTTILKTFGFDPGGENTREAANAICLENTHHPVRDYLRGLEWDGTPRVETWMAVYLGADDTPLTRAIGRIVLVAGVRRIRHPGVKYDTIVVLEGAQGTGKSSALVILAGPENFSDQDILTLDPKAQMEAMEGIWIYEIGELQGLSRADTTKVKAFASRSVDRGRPAYGRFRENRPRQTVFIGTTNEDQYLRDPTGNRRFWPVRTGTIDLEALRRERDQLWAEAASLEAGGVAISLDQALWVEAQVEQEARMEDDPWIDVLSRVAGDLVSGHERISSNLLLEVKLQIPPERQQQYHLKRLAGAMRKLGWKAKFKAALRFLLYSPTVRAISSAQKAGLKLLASSIGRSAQTRLHCVSAAIGLIAFAIFKKTVEIAVPTEPGCVGEDVIGADGQKAANRCSDWETGVVLNPCIQPLTCLTQCCVRAVIFKPSTHLLEAWLPLLDQHALKTANFSIEQEIMPCPPRPLRCRSIEITFGKL